MELTPIEARDVAAVLRLKAECERSDAAGAIHNAMLSKLASASRLDALAERFEAWVADAQERANERNRPKRRPSNPSR